MTEADGSRTAFDFRKRLRPKTYSIAIYVVVFFLFVEVCFLLSVFWFRQQFTLETQGPAMPPVAEADATPTASSQPSDNPSARLPVPKVATREDRILQLNDQARKFRMNGQLALSRTTLQQALELDPNYPNTLMGLAMIEEDQDKYRSALSYWKKISALPNLSQVQSQLARERIAMLEDRIRAEAATQPQEASVPPPPTVTVRKPEVSITQVAPKLISIPDVIQTPSVLPSVPENITLDFQLKANSPTQYIIPSKMRIQIFLYDQLSTGERVPDVISARFTNSNPFSQPGATETLEVNYSRSAQKDFQQRAFYGYIMRVYYNGELQDEKASSPELLKQ